MKKEYFVTIDEITYPVLFSDEKEALLAAKAAGRAVLGLWDEKNPQAIPAEIPYAVEEETQINEVLLERLVRRNMGLPWMIAETKRLRIREFIPGDWEEIPATFLCYPKAERTFPETKREVKLPWEEKPEIFTNRSAFLSYLRYQYSFYEYGLWAVEEKMYHRLIGGCGIWDREIQENGNMEVKKKYGRHEEKSMTEIGYWISPSFQKMGYGTEAVEAVLSYAMQIEKVPVYATIREENIPSRKLAEKLKFTPVPHSHPGQNGARQLRYQYVPYY